MITCPTCRTKPFKKGDLRRTLQGLVEPIGKVCQHATAEDLPHLYGLMSQLADKIQRLENETESAKN